MGPSLLFDKSFLQSLSVDEAAMLDQLFSCIVTPLFFAETLGSLAKEETKGRSSQARVAELATKTPVAHSYMNAFHHRMMLNELLGETVEMKRRPSVPGGIPVMVEGRASVVYKKSAETEAFERWQRGRFPEVDQIASKAWRSHLGELDLPAMASVFKAALQKEARPKKHSDALALAQAIVDAPGQNYKTLLLAIHLLDFPSEARNPIVKTWKMAGRPSLSTFAPYTAFCLRIDLYFYLALSNGLISDQRASNKIDMGYLYYLPFARIFVSSDRLHQTSAELFLEADQSFVWGPELKDDLAALNKRFMGCCQSNANPSPLGAISPMRERPQAMSDCHSARADERRSL